MPENRTGRPALLRRCTPLLGALLYLLCLQAALAYPLDFLPLDEYLKHHPDQTQRMDAFARVVRSDAVPLQVAQQAPVRIAIVYPALQTSDYWRRSVTALQARLDELHIRYALRTYYSRPSHESGKQARQLRQALAWQPDYLIFTLDALSDRQMIEPLLLRGKPRLILQNITTPVQDWSEHPPFLYVGFDHQAGTRLLARKMLQNSDIPVRYSLLYFSRGYVSQMRGDTFVTEAAKRPDVERLSSYYTGGDIEQARAATLKELDRHPRLNMLFACSTDVALGAAEALRERGRLGQVTLNGWGGGKAELDALARGDLDLTVLRINDDNGVAIAEAIKADLERHTERVPQVFSGDMVLITSTTPRDRLIELEKRAFRYSGND